MPSTKPDTARVALLKVGYSSCLDSLALGASSSTPTSCLRGGGTSGSGSWPRRRASLTASSIGRCRMERLGDFQAACDLRSSLWISASSTSTPRKASRRTWPPGRGFCSLASPLSLPARLSSMWSLHSTGWRTLQSMSPRSWRPSLPCMR